MTIKDDIRDFGFKTWVLGTLERFQYWIFWSMLFLVAFLTLAGF